MTENKEKCTELATRMYELDGEVYKSVGSALGRTFTGDREKTIRNLSALMFARPDAHILRSELALIGNMAHTIKNGAERERLLKEYGSILHEVESLPTSFSEEDIANQERIHLNHLIARYRKPTGEDHMVICISRTQGSGANEIGFELADELGINYYDEEIINQVMKRLGMERDAGEDPSAIKEMDKYKEHHGLNLKEAAQNFNRYHGLPKQDAMFFNMSDLIVDLAQKEDCVIMGRAADSILKNNRIPHISLFISAPLPVRVQYTMKTRNMSLKDATRFVRKMDHNRKKYYDFYTGEKWGKPDNYDMCINSANYGMRETIDIILRLLNSQPRKIEA